MKDFVYSATARDGSVCSGQVSAVDRTAAFRELDALQLQPLSLGEKVEKRTVESDTRLRLKAPELIDFTSELADLLKGGIPLEKALGIISRREGRSSIPAIAAKIRAGIRDGKSLSDSLQQSSPAFDELCCRLVTAGEESGSLHAILSRHAAHLKSVDGLKNKVLSALIYPAFLIVASIAVTVLFVTFLIPKLMELLESTGGSLPVGAQLLVDAGAFFQSTWILWTGLLSVVLIVLVRFARSHPEKWERLKLSIPLSGGILHLRQQVQFLETMACLIRNGLPVMTALQLTRNAAVSPVYRKDIDQMRSKVKEGTSLAKSLYQSDLFPSLMAELVEAGEQTGDLAGALERASSRFNTVLSRKVERLGSLVQPAVVVMMAGLVGCMAYLMITAIFQTVADLGG